MTWHPDIPEEYRNQIVTGDARELAKLLPDESIDVIWCDPVFNRMADYDWLAETASRVLVQGGNCIAEIGTQRLPNVTAIMSKHLDYVWQLIERYSGGAPRMWSKRIMVMYASYLWYSKGIRAGGWVSDFGLGTYDKYSHIWGDGEYFIANYIDRLTDHDSIILDPFTGGGTIPAICKKLERNYIAFEIDPATADIARARVINTQPPLFTLQPQQQEMQL